MEDSSTGGVTSLFLGLEKGRKRFFGVKQKLEQQEEVREMCVKKTYQN